MTIRIEITNFQDQLAMEASRMEQAVRTVLLGEAISDAEISLAVVDDARIREVHRQFLAEDQATDVISFALNDVGMSLEGELVVSAETAARMAPRFHWSAEEELLLYVIHGALHLAGYEDQEPAARAAMRQREAHFLQVLGLPSDRHGDCPPAAPGGTAPGGGAG